MKTKLVYCSVDPGVSGACVLEFEDGTVEVYSPPVIVTEKLVTSGKRKGKTSKKTSYNLPELVKLFPEGECVHFIIENVSRMPNDSAHASSLLMEGKGFYRGIAAARGYIEHLVLPTVWKKKVGLPKGATKEDSRQLAIAMYPQLADQLKLKKDEGKAEALLMLHYLKEFALKPCPVKRKSKKTK